MRGAKFVLCTVSRRGVVTFWMVTLFAASSDVNCAPRGTFWAFWIWYTADPVPMPSGPVTTKLAWLRRWYHSPRRGRTMRTRRPTPLILAVAVLLIPFV